MSSLKNDFDELIECIKHGRNFDHASFEPIYYLIFPPSKILSVKRNMPAWCAKLTNEGWHVNVFSMAEHVNQILTTAKPRKIWLIADKKEPLNWKRTNAALANTINQGMLQLQLEETLAKLESDSKAILIVTDLEALHPYTRIGAIESQLYGKFKIPTVFLYPGQRTGNTRLRFMNFYPEDGNYRSVHIGGN